MSPPPRLRGPSILQTLEYTYRPLELFERCARRLGEPFTLHLPGFGDFVFVWTPETLKQVFTGDPDELQAGKANDMLEPVVGPYSLLLLDGAEHIRMRRLLLPPFHGERMQTYGRLIAGIASAEIDAMPLGAPFSIHTHMQAITMRVILRAVFGLEEGAEMRELTAVLLEYMKPPPSLLVFTPRSLFPWLDFPGSPYRTFLRRRDGVDRSLRAIIRARRAAPDPSRTDILSLLLDARDEQGAPLTEDELRDELMTMLLAGHETTATALSWALAHVISNPEVEARLRAEIGGLSSEGGVPDAAALTSAPYLDAVVKETMRLHPIVPVVVRRLSRPMTIAGREVAEGAMVTPCIHLAHRRPEAWPEPERFNPERFLGTKTDPYTWFPFGGGTRRCVGMAFALYEMKIVLGVMLARTRLALDKGRFPEVVRRSVTLAPAGGTRVVMTERH